LKTTKQLINILAPLQQSDDAQFIEKLPGIEKSALYGWAKGKILQNSSHGPVA